MSRHVHTRFFCDRCHAVVNRQDDTPYAPAGWKKVEFGYPTREKPIQREHGGDLCEPCARAFRDWWMEPSRVRVPVDNQTT